MRTISESFEVHEDDLPSEERLEYRDVITRALGVYLKSGEATPDDARRIDKLLCDCYRAEPTTYDELGRPADDKQDEIL